MSNILQRSIIHKLFFKAFSVYLLLASFVTMIHVVGEFVAVKQRIFENIDALNKTFSPILASSLWLYDDRGIYNALEGINNNPFVVGVSLTDDEEKETYNLGRVFTAPPKGEKKPEVRFFDQILPRSYPLFFNNKVKTGELVIYTSTKVILIQISHSITFILVNALIKSFALWLIFIWVASIMVKRPLEILNRSVQQLGGEDPGKVPPEERELLDVKDEMGQLARSLDHLRSGILDNMVSMRQDNRQMSNKVHQKAESLDKKAAQLDGFLQGFTQLLYQLQGKAKLAGEHEGPFLKLEVEREIKLISLTAISRIFIREHYLTYLFLEGKEWKQASNFGNLKELEEEYGERLVRVNRSTLINPQHLKELRKEGDRVFIVMRDNLGEDPVVSKSRLKELSRLIKRYLS